MRKLKLYREAVEYPDNNNEGVQIYKEICMAYLYKMSF